jgi:cytochrome c peroxidase
MQQLAFIKPSLKFFGLTATSIFLIVALLSFSGCKEDCPVSYVLDVPPWFPIMEIPFDNQLTQARIDLGRKLFYEPLLSLDSTVSCATCHLQENAFTDGLPISIGADGVLGMRNAPTLANIGYSPSFFDDGGVETLELQSQSPIFAVEEMNFSIAGFLDRIEDDGVYNSMFQQAYGREPDAFGITRAIACFERTIISGNSRFDQYYYQNDLSALSESEIRGMNLFLSTEAKCESCHQLPLFTNFEFENIGLYTTYADSGRARITHLTEDKGKFKVPTLRNVEVTSPYMHDGSMQSLEEVVEHFNAGGVAHVNQSVLVQPLALANQEQEDLVAFLKSLTDQSLLNNPDLVE